MYAIPRGDILHGIDIPIPPQEDAAFALGKRPKKAVDGLCQFACFKRLLDPAGSRDALG